jgi:hypothetical protein
MLIPRCPSPNGSPTTNRGGHKHWWRYWHCHLSLLLATAVRRIWRTLSSGRRDHRSDNEQIGWGSWPPSHACAGCSPCLTLGRTPLSKASRNAGFGCYFTAPRAISRQSCPTVEQIVLQATSVLKLHCICRLLVPRAATRFGLGECEWTCACKGSTRANGRPKGLSMGGAVCRTSAFRTIGASSLKSNRMCACSTWSCCGW